MGPAASGRKYGNLTSCFNASQDTDVILLMPLENNAYYSNDFTLPSDRTLFVKGDIGKNYDHRLLYSDAASKVRLLNSTSAYPKFSASGYNNTTNVIFESLHLDTTHGITFGGTPYGNIIFNKCRISVSTNNQPLLKSMSNGLIELRNCFIDFRGGSGCYLTNSMGEGAIINLVKCTCTDVSKINEASTNGNARFFSMETLDVVDHSNLIDGYGVHFGKEIVSLEYPIIAGRILDNGLPASKLVYLYRKASQRRIMSTVSDNDGYFEFDARNLLLDEYVLMTLKNPALSNEYVIINDVRPVDPRS